MRKFILSEDLFLEAGGRIGNSNMPNRTMPGSGSSNGNGSTGSGGPSQLKKIKNRKSISFFELADDPAITFEAFRDGSASEQINMVKASLAKVGCSNLKDAIAREIAAQIATKGQHWLLDNTFLKIIIILASTGALTEMEYSQYQYVLYGQGGGMIPSIIFDAKLNKEITTDFSVQNMSAIENQIQKWKSRISDLRSRTARVYQNIAIFWMPELYRDFKDSVDFTHIIVFLKGFMRPSSVKGFNRIPQGEYDKFFNTLWKQVFDGRHFIIVGEENKPNEASWTTAIINLLKNYDNNAPANSNRSAAKKAATKNASSASSSSSADSSSPSIDSSFADDSDDSSENVITKALSQNDDAKKHFQNAMVTILKQLSQQNLLRVADQDLENLSDQEWMDLLKTFTMPKNNDN